VYKKFLGNINDLVPNIIAEALPEVIQQTGATGPTSKNPIDHEMNSVDIREFRSFDDIFFPPILSH
jgi:hypothetical protein